ncbi:hypothetical protein A2634_00430 [Candidatus Amesbacteria bacterium RIFCSPHIGHO2_01_FULL_48_32]|uniref:Endolytic murein transglycosylase n=1 Tax=Candidatus Amesbacteria bacterium RIFCSPLOWO2_01_FULL_48_25 TaxID=1797259 RepID=A0A1F4ZCX9_9BACT|nr:MAG: hypothetical protein A2634_00430 [Candidatus Amesbacteria bacterium RIFCSPHIGHO2_01_FULL_48_32]OGD03274.1 MAG: hypothetical protein A2989_00380 [Candidatus Amesbacteria bacterium RIFCSPLOWO2_01_FULL_48_25]HJZ05222.1 endolytic transglycosylase MltG [Patescibacteria group bacterium]
MTGKNLSLILALFLGFCAAASITFSYFWIFSQLSPAGSSGSPSVTFNIAPNQPALTTVSSLHTTGLIRSILAARVYLKFTGLDSRLRPGSYSLSPALSAKEIFAALATGPQDVKITLPEGWRREQIALRVSSDLPNFDTLEFVYQTASIEGQLFPDTYRFSPTSQASDVIRIMTENFRRKSGLSIPSQQDLLIIASLVEREAKLAVDRPIIAGIIQKRLKNNWPLQIDATVQYARDSANCQLLTVNCQFWQPVFDTKLSSVFNTYQNVGLPPHPIANPGLASIQAVLAPVDSPYWYYLAGTDGVTYYAKTLTEHNINVDKYLKP